MNVPDTTAKICFRDYVGDLLVQARGWELLHVGQTDLRMAADGETVYVVPRVFSGHRIAAEQVRADYLYAQRVAARLPMILAYTGHVSKDSKAFLRKTVHEVLDAADLETMVAGLGTGMQDRHRQYADKWLRGKRR